MDIKPVNTVIVFEIYMLTSNDKDDKIKEVYEQIN